MLPLRIDVYHHIELGPEVLSQFNSIHKHLGQMESRMTAQVDKLRTDVAALIKEAIDDITAAIAAAQTASNDPAIDQLDTDVTAATQALKDKFATQTGTPVPPTTP
jgi:hypothetical protein